MSTEQRLIALETLDFVVKKYDNKEGNQPVFPSGGIIMDSAVKFLRQQPRQKPNVDVPKSSNVSDNGHPRSRSS